MPTRYMATIEEIIIREFLKSQDKFYGATFEHLDPPDFIVTLQKEETFWVEITCAYRTQELAKNLNCAETGIWHSEFLGTECAQRQLHINRVRDGIIKKDGKQNYRDLAEKYGKGVLILHIDDPLATCDDLRFVGASFHYSDINLKIFDKIYLYIRSQIDTTGQMPSCFFLLLKKDC